MSPYPQKAMKRPSSPDTEDEAAAAAAVGAATVKRTRLGKIMSVDLTSPEQQKRNINHSLQTSPRPTRSISWLFETVIALNSVRSRLTLYLRPKDYLALMGTTRMIRRPLYADRFDINKRLGRFVRRPLMLRHCIHFFNALVAGDFVLQMIEGSNDDSRNNRVPELDIYIIDGEDATILCNYIASEGYTCISQKPAMGGGSTGQVRIYETMIPTVADGKPHKRRINLTASTFGHPPLKVILETARMTSQVNLMSWNTIYSVFPYATFVEGKRYTLQARDEHFSRQIYRCIERGGCRHQDIISPWVRYEEGPRTKKEAGGPLGSSPGRGSIIHTDHITLDSYALSESLLGGRRIGDTHCCTIKLDMKGLLNTPEPRIPVPDTILEMSGFTMTVIQTDVRQDNHFAIEANAFGSPMLRYTYVLGALAPSSSSSTISPSSSPPPSGISSSGEAGGAEGGPWDAVIAWLKDCLADQVRAKVDRDEWVSLGVDRWIARMQGRGWFGFDPPKDWTYYDQFVPDMYASCERRRKKGGRRAGLIVRQRRLVGGKFIRMTTTTTTATKPMNGSGGGIPTRAVGIGMGMGEGAVVIENGMSSSSSSPPLPLQQQQHQQQPQPPKQVMHNGGQEQHQRMMVDGDDDDDDDDDDDVNDGVEPLESVDVDEPWAGLRLL